MKYKLQQKQQRRYDLKDRLPMQKLLRIRRADEIEVVVMQQLLVGSSSPPELQQQQQQRYYSSMKKESESNSDRYGGASSFDIS
jgi:hypothetical protein